MAVRVGCVNGQSRNALHTRCFDAGPIRRSLLLLSDRRTETRRNGTLAVLRLPPTGLTL